MLADIETAQIMGRRLSRELAQSPTLPKLGIISGEDITKEHVSVLNKMWWVLANLGTTRETVLL